VSSEKSQFIVTQLGAREHYIVPRALHQREVLDRLVTDVWLPPGNLLATFWHGLSSRYHKDLSQACVRASNTKALRFEARSRLAGLSGWQLIIQRNNWFQHHAVIDLICHHEKLIGQSRTVFAYSYAARKVLEFARDHGWPTVLQQIDPGPAEERLVESLYNDNPAVRGNWQPAPAEYWEEWREECKLADKIVVNSRWSYDALVQECVSPDKIRILPLAYEPSTDANSFVRHYPTEFSKARPLRVLFLGQINLRKGGCHVFDAVKLLCEEPIEFWFVGPLQLSVPKNLSMGKNVRWFGIAAREDTGRYYRGADVFILPTYSDGFALTQLEAQSWKLPVIVSRFCGGVVCDGVNGVILREITGEAIAKVLLEFARDPAMLFHMAVHSGVDDRFSLKTLAQSLLAL
jgi:glycosyltransferase involved in cell wall biosynthesis